MPAESPHVFDVLSWKVSGELPFKHTSRGDVNASRVLTTWRLACEALKDVLAEKKVARVIQKSPFVAHVPPEESREQGLGLFLPPARWRTGQSPKKGAKAPLKNFFTVKFERTRSCSLKSLRKSLLGNQCIQL